uniref:PB2 n=1 Tax=Tiliqua thogotovirus TaxID=2992311 RepID=A0A9E7V620_9ORTO|nr:PB2 [Tiliqua thogotovirus]
MEPKEQERLLKHLIDGYKTCKEEASEVLEKQFVSYDTFKRYTTSKKDHAPQMRLCYSVRQMYPITMRRSKSIPAILNGIPLKDKRYDLGESDRIRCSISVPDYWMAEGTETTQEIAEAMLYCEMQKVDRFLSTEFGPLQFGKMLPYRKPVQVNPTIVEISQTTITPTLMEVFCPQYCLPETKRKANPEAVNKLNRILAPLGKHKTTEAAVNMARNLIHANKKWLPTIIEHSPKTAELSHFLCSRYHHQLVHNQDVKPGASLDMLCFELVKRCLKSRSPKQALINNIKYITIGGRSMETVLEENNGEYQSLGICRVALGFDTHVSTTVRQTKFCIMKSESPRIETMAVFHLGPEVQTKIPFRHFKGEAQVHFTHGNSTHGYFVCNGRNLEKIEVSTTDGFNLLPLLLDIGKYGAFFEPGFEKPFDFFPTNEREFNETYFLHHSKDHISVLRHLGLSANQELPLSPELIWKEPSKGKVAKVFELKHTVQPYSDTSEGFYISETLSVYSVTSQGMELLINPNKINRPKTTPLPVGTDLSRCEFPDIVSDPFTRAKTLFKSMVLSKNRCKEFATNMEDEYQDTGENVVASIVPPNSWKSSAKRKLRAIIESDEDWASCPRKRAKVCYFATIVGSNQLRDAKPRPVPNEFVLQGTQTTVDSSLRKGLVVDTGNRILIGGETVLREDVGGAPGYIQTGVFEKQPNCYLVKSAEEGARMNLKRYCLQSQGRYFQYEEKMSIWDESDNIQSTLERQRNLSKRREIEEQVAIPYKRQKTEVTGSSAGGDV